MTQWTQKQERLKERAFLPAGIIVSNLIAPYLRRGTTPPSPYEFVPGYQHEQTPDEAVSEMDAFFRNAQRMKEQGLLIVPKKRSG